MFLHDVIKSGWDDPDLYLDTVRFRWLLNGNSYFLEEERLCGHRETVTEEDKKEARRRIDKMMIEESKNNLKEFLEKE